MDGAINLVRALAKEGRVWIEGGRVYDVLRMNGGLHLIVQLERMGSAISVRISCQHSHFSWTCTSRRV